MDASVIENPVFVGTVTFFLGICGAVIAQRILNKQALLTYFVKHLKVCQTTEDAVFGSVEVKWNGSDVPNLYLSTVELTNQSVQDFEDLEVTAFTDNTTLLTERTEILGTTRYIEWTASFLGELQVGTEGKLSDEQFQLMLRKREYHVPVLNRDQTVRITFLHSAVSDGDPSICLDIVHKGVKVKYRVPQAQILGVDQPKAAAVGALIGTTATVTMILLANTTWLIALIAFVLGLAAQLPGVAAIRLWRWLRGLFVS